MSEITRYDIVQDDGLDSLDLGPREDGGYVRYEDHARLLAAKEAEVEWLRKTSERNENMLSYWRSIGICADCKCPLDKHDPEQGNCEAGGFPLCGCRARERYEMAKSLRG